MCAGLGGHQASHLAAVATEHLGCLVKNTHLQATKCIAAAAAAAGDVDDDNDDEIHSRPCRALG